jgi:hypothetical protein
MEPLFLCALLFHESPSSRYDTLKTLHVSLVNPLNTTTLTDESRLSLLPLLLYALKTDPVPEIQAELLHCTIPSLAANTTDPFVCARVLALVSSLLAGTLDRDAPAVGYAPTAVSSVLVAAALRGLVALWKAQSRVWTHV